MASRNRWFGGIALLVVVACCSSCGATRLMSGEGSTVESTTAVETKQIFRPPPDHKPKPKPPGPGQVSGSVVESEVSKQLQLANVAFNAPTSLQRGETAEIELLVSRKVSAAGLQKQVAEPGAIEAHSGIKVSNGWRQR